MNDYQKSLVKRALSDCLVVNGEIVFLSPLSPEEVKQVYIGLTEDLFSYNIPHYRVVGILFSANKTYTKSVVKKHDIFNKSIVELSMDASMIIPLDLGGNDKEDECYCFSNTEVIGSNKRKLNLFRGVSNIPDWKKDRFPFEYDPDSIGQLVYTIDNLALEEAGINNSIMGTDTLLYNSSKIVYNPSTMPEYLLSAINIADMSDTKGIKLSDIVFFYHKGVGTMEYNQTAEFFKYDSDIFPCRAVYDLTKVFTVIFPSPADTTLKYYSPYKGQLNEQGLSRILQDYANGLEVS